MFFAATEAWDQRMSKTSQVRTVSIPTGSIPTLKFELTDPERDQLYRWGHDNAREFFRTQGEYLNSYGQRAEGPAAQASLESGG